MYFAELKDKSLRLAFGKNLFDTINWCIEKWGDELEAIYRDNLHDPFIKVWDSKKQSEIL